MVYFSCSGCNESLKKPKVAAHLSFCRRCHILTCLDCQKDFTSQSYVTHNQCITELEKYSGKNYVEPANANKGQKKQLSWMDSVRAAIAEYPKQHDLHSREHRQVNSLLSSLLRFDNIPRKKTKFENFVKSAIGQFRRDQPAIDAAWVAISTPRQPQEVVEKAFLNKQKKEDEEDEEEKEAEEEEAVEPKKKKKKKEEEEGEEQGSESKKKKIKRENDVETSQEVHEVSQTEVTPKKKKKKRKETAEKEEVETPKKRRKKEEKCEEQQSESKKKGDSGIESSEEAHEVSQNEEDPHQKEEKAEAPEACEEEAAKFVLVAFVTDMLQRRDGGISFSKLEKRAVKAYMRSFARPNKEPRPERVKRKLKMIVAKHFREIDGRVFERGSN